MDKCWWKNNVIIVIKRTKSIGADFQLLFSFNILIVIKEAISIAIIKVKASVITAISASKSTTIKGVTIAIPKAVFTKGDAHKNNKYY